MKLTPTQKNVVGILKQVIDRAFARMASTSRKRALALKYSADVPIPIREIDPVAINTLFSEAASCEESLLKFAFTTEQIRMLIRRCIWEAYASRSHQMVVERYVLEDLQAHAEEYEMLSHMPLPRRERKARVPKTLVARRAEKADAKVAEWERKFKYARTKLAAYRKKKKYYAKKGRD